ncbi:hypothetical protein D3C80_1707550 [compost metagenome]
MFDRGAEHLQLHTQVGLRRVDAHHRQRNVEEHVDDLHELKKRLGVLAAEATNLGSGFLTVTPENQRLPIRMQIHIPRRELHRFETVALQPEFRRHMGMHTHRHHVQGTGVDQVLRRFGYQIAR